jgi:hypothetical protein
MLPPEERLIGAQLHRYVRDKLYRMLHAPRQTGKTTFLQNWMREINAGKAGDNTGAVACYVTVEACQGISEIERAMPILCSALPAQAAAQGIPAPALTNETPGNMLNNILGNWAARVAPRPLVVLFDETDVLQDETLISFLRQLRAGFATRGVGVFPVSIALVGMRDLKDYITASKGGVAPNPGSPFNVKADSAVIGNFAREDIARLFGQHTAETGQQITQEALDYAWEQSRGQPWIVNSLFMRATMRVLDADSTETVMRGHIHEARQQMIIARETHLEALTVRMRDPKVRYVLETLLTGTPDLKLSESDAFAFCLDLGLVTRENGIPTVANPIYREVLARQMTIGAQDMLPPLPGARWQRADGTLDMDKLLREFQGFWQENSATWEETSSYTEAFPHLLLMAFLQRITNGEGRIEREYAAGRGRTDLAIEYKGRWHILEIKLRRKGQSFEKVKADGARQILEYRDTFSPALRSADGAPPGCYLLVFDRRPEAADTPWSERIKWETVGEVTVIGC